MAFTCSSSTFPPGGPCSQHGGPFMTIDGRTNETDQKKKERETARRDLWKEKQGLALGFKICEHKYPRHIEGAFLGQGRERLNPKGWAVNSYYLDNSHLSHFFPSHLHLSICVFGSLLWALPLDGFSLVPYVSYTRTNGVGPGTSAARGTHTHGSRRPGWPGSWGMGGWDFYLGQHTAAQHTARPAKAEDWAAR